MWPFLIVVACLIVAILLIFAPNPIINKIHGGPVKINKKKVKKIMLGMNFTDGLIYKIFIYAFLIVVSFIFLYPMIYMIFTSLKPQMDLADSASGLLPSSLFFKNYSEAFRELGYFKALYKSIIVSMLPTLFNVIIGCLTAYGFARFNFPLKKFWFAIMITTYIVPTALISIPRYAWYAKLKLLGSILTYILPASLGQGLCFALYFMILYSTFRRLPVQLEESARIDGANNLQIFFRIALPLVVPSIITVLLFSFVWYWNDSQTASMYLNIVKVGQSAPRWVTLPIALQNYQNSLLDRGEREILLYQGVKMAAVFLSILPLLINYFVLQRFFVEGIEKSGIAGE